MGLLTEAKMQYSLTDLLQNDTFIDWVLHPTTESDAYWLAYSSVSAQNGRTVATARGYVSLLAEDTGRQTPSVTQSEQMWQGIQDNISHEKISARANFTTAETDNRYEERAPRPFGYFKKKWQLAASVTILLAFSTAAYQYYHFENNSSPSKVAAIVSAQPETIARHNTTQKSMTVLLPDGSSAVLLPGGQIEYLSQNSTGNRAVTLTGKAFFEIVKDKNRPFYVFTDGITTKVLGTSFLIDAPADTDEVKVEVKTGRVSVFKANKQNVFALEGVMEGQTTILTPNQKSAFSRSKGEAIKPLETTSPNEGAKSEASFDQSFAFDDTPAAEVFDALQRTYNIPIHFDRALLKDCTLNATLVGEPFGKKLSVICAALGAEFKILNDEVFITGKACQ